MAVAQVTIEAAGDGSGHAGAPVSPARTARPAPARLLLEGASRRASVASLPRFTGDSKTMDVRPHQLPHSFTRTELSNATLAAASAVSGAASKRRTTGAHRAWL